MNDTTIVSELDGAVAFQRRWRRITSFSYFAGASLSVIAAATATVVAGLGYAATAAVVAAAATVFTSLEKVLLFREKWTHHRAVETELELVRLKYAAHELDDRTAVLEIERIIRFYSAKLPMAGGVAELE